jgi:glycosyltransferase involved in cell wall biosynthesis
MAQIAVIVPALNEAGNIGRLAAEVIEVMGEVSNHHRALDAASIEAFQVIVVDNGSADATGEEARAAGAQVVHEARRGYGYACAAGVAAASNTELLVFIDGDYSCLPSELPQLLGPLLGDDADLVVGSRTRGHILPGAMSPPQRFGNWLVACLMNHLYGIHVTDLGPYRAVRRSLLESLDMREMTYGWPTEMMVKAAKRGARIQEVPVSFHPRQIGRSKVSGTLRGTVLAAWFILGVTLRYVWKDPGN